MNQQIIKEKIDFLRQEIEHHNYLYYVEAKPVISDLEYDCLLKELEDLEKQYPEYDSLTSPTKKIGGEPLKGFKQYPHLVPMLSLGNTYNKQELAAFSKRVSDRLNNSTELKYIIEPKIDGVSISVRYENGILVRALTRGDGKKGDDVTQNVRTIKNLPLKLKTNNPPAVFEVRGEIYMPNSGFEALNKKRQQNGEELLANPRNATAGTLKLLDSKIVAQRPLSVIFYGTGEVDGVEISSQSQLLNLLKEYGLPSHDWTGEASDFKSLWDKIEECDKVRKEFDYDTDGAVIKLDKVDLREIVGYTAKYPSWAIAYKYAAATAFTKLKSITVQVGRTGILTPVAELESVVLAGSRISRATLHNEEEIKRKDIRIGDIVEIKKAGEVIPAVISVDLNSRSPESKSFDMAEYLDNKCPCCSAPIVKDTKFVAWKCENLYCPAQNTRRVRYFATRQALDIQMLGDVVADGLVNSGLVKEPLDLFDLKIEDLEYLNLGTEDEPRMFGRKNGIKLLEALNNAQKLPLHRWICALGIPNVGTASSFELAQFHGDFEHFANSDILRKAQKFYQLSDKIKLLKKKKDVQELAQTINEYEQVLEELKALNMARPATKKNEWLLNFGPKMVDSILDYFESPFGKEVVQKLRKKEINPQAELSKQSNNEISGKVFVLTGTLTSMDRNKASELLRELGAQVSGSVTKKTDYLIMGGAETGGKKSEQAHKLGVTILTEEDFLNLLERNQSKNNVEEKEQEKPLLSAEHQQLTLF